MVPKCRSLGEGENVSESLVNKHFVLIDQLVIYKTKNGSLEDKLSGLVTGKKEHP